MVRTGTSRYDSAEHLRTPEEMAAYLEASFDTILRVMTALGLEHYAETVQS